MKHSNSKKALRFNFLPWQSSFGFIIASVGSAVGLGNLWKFPYITYANGGGAFVVVYLISIMLIGLPLMLAEFIMGKHVRDNIYNAFRKLSNNHPFWRVIGFLCSLTTFLVLSFYSVVSGWTLYYFFKSLTPEFYTITKDSTGPLFGQFLANGPVQIFFHTLVMSLTTLIVIKGVKRIELANKIFMPVLFLVVVILAIHSLSYYGASDTLDYLFNLDFSKLTLKSYLEAFGHAFFTLSLGGGAMFVYGSYLPEKTSILGPALWISLFDTLCAIFATFMIFPILFGTKMQVQESTSIIFTTLSLQFSQIPGGHLLSPLFFLLMSFAALSSTISLLESSQILLEKNFNIERKKSTLLTGLIIWFFGVICALGLNENSFFAKINLFSHFDYITSTWSLPLGSLFIAYFAIRKISKEDILKVFCLPEKKLYIFSIWKFIIRYITPLLILAIFLFQLKLI